MPEPTLPSRDLVRAALEATRANPRTVLVEIAWRWSFGAMALALFALGVHSFLKATAVTDEDLAALHGTDVQGALLAILHIGSQAGFWPRFYLTLIAVAFPSLLLWIAFATAGRWATLQRMGLKLVTARSVLGLAVLRAFAMVAAMLAWFVWMVLCAMLTVANSAEPNYLLYLALSTLALPVILVAWGLVNWWLSLAPVLAEDGATAALRRSWNACNIHRRELSRMSSYFATLRLVAMIAALVLMMACAYLPVVAASVTITIIGLAYCAFADRLYVVRLAAYALLLRSGPSTSTTG